MDEPAIGERAYRNLGAYSPGCVVAIPPHLAENLRAWHGAEGEQWLAELPDRVAAVERSWRLQVAEPFAEDGAVSWVAPAVTGSGEQLVLKLFLPDVENALEGEALRHYDGRGAVRVLEMQPGVLLLERALPGDSLWKVPDDAEAVTVASALLQQLWRAPAPDHPFRTLAADAGGWSQSIMRHWQQLGGPCERELAELGAQLALDLSASQGEQVLLHQDLHGGNILRAQRQPWLAIDPKPLVGEREFDLASLIRDCRWQIDEGTVRGRLDLLARLLPLDRERMRGWAIVHALEWGMDATGADQTMLACARWLSRM
jgi:streptomycin 6-kinase